jgi:outer membrane protein assembly factor BamB
MNERLASTVSGTATAVAAVAVLWWWLSLAPTLDLGLRIPLEANVAARGRAAKLLIVDLNGSFLAFAGKPSPLPGAWPRFRGPFFDNISRQTVPLARTWPETGPPLLWTLDLGEGHAGPAVFGGRVYVLDYDEEQQADSLRCFSLDDGAEIWRRWYKVPVKRNHGMSRTVPAVTERYVVAVGPKCHVLCVDADNGRFLWGKDLVREFGAKVPLWYTGQCPLIDNDIAVLAPGGEALLIGVDCATGEVLWRTPNPRRWKMSHSSVMPMDFAGRRMYLYCAIGGLVAVAADGPDRGNVLWETDAWSPSVVSPSPVIFDDGRVFVTAGYGAGSMMLQVSFEGKQFSARPLYALEKTVFACEQQTPILYDGYLYAVLPNDAGTLRREFACFNPAGELVWTSGKENRFGLGPFLAADDKMFILNDDGHLTMIEATPRGYIPLARARVLTGRDAWGPMALVDGRLLLRDWKTLACIDLRQAGLGAAFLQGD